MHYLVPLFFAGGVFFTLGPTLTILWLLFFLLYVAVFFLALRAFAKEATFYKALGISNWAGVCALAVWLLLSLALREAVSSNPKVLKYILWNPSSPQDLKIALWFYGVLWTLFCLWLWVFFTRFYVERPLTLRIAACVVAFAVNYVCVYALWQVVPDSAQRQLAKHAMQDIMEIHGKRWAAEMNKQMFDPAPLFR